MMKSVQSLQDATSDRVAQLLAATPTNTAFVPLHKLHRDPEQRLRSPSPPRPFQNVGSARSAGSDTDFSTFSTFSSLSATSLSLRKVIESLEEKIKYDQSCGLLHDHLSAEKLQISADICSWNRKVPKKYRGRSRLPVNILGCHQPAQLIVARADERIRRQVMAKEVKEQKMEEVVRYIDHLITMKLTRGERYAAQLELQQKQTKWSVIIKLIKYSLTVEPLVRNMRKECMEVDRVDRAARKLQVKFTSWYERRILMRYVNFLSKVNDSMWRIRLQLGILQKRSAVRIIKTFLVERNQNQEVSKLVHSFLTGIRHIQSMARAFIACKMERIRALSVLWEDIEEQYLMSVLAKRRQEVSRTGSSRKNQDLVLDERTRIEMDKQAARWESTDKKFTKVLENYRKNGELDNAVESANISTLKVPEDIRTKICADIIRLKRRQHTENMEEIQKKLANSLMFSVEDAAALLRAPKATVDLRMNVVDTSGKIVQSFMPFNLFSMLQDVEILDKIKETHATLNTFRVKGETVSLLRMKKSVMAGARRAGFVIQRQSSSRDYDALFKSG